MLATGPAADLICRALLRAKQIVWNVQRQDGRIFPVLLCWVLVLTTPINRVFWWPQKSAKIVNVANVCVCKTEICSWLIFWTVTPRSCAKQALTSTLGFNSHFRASSGSTRGLVLHKHLGFQFGHLAPTWALGFHPYFLWRAIQTFTFALGFLARFSRCYPHLLVVVAPAQWANVGNGC